MWELGEISIILPPPTYVFQDVVESFKKLMQDNPDTPQAVAAINALIEYINQLHSGNFIRRSHKVQQIPLRSDIVQRQWVFEWGVIPCFFLWF